MFSPVTAADNIREEFIGYISTSFHISDKDYAAQFAEALREEGAVSKGPFLDVSGSYEKGRCLEDMIESGEVSPLFRTLEKDVPDGSRQLQLNRSLYLHQEKAVQKINQGRNLVVTTGTGSGKTECFIIPIINHLLREAEKGELTPGVRAIIVYPMNALANDQMKRMRKLLKSYPDITFGVYNRDTQYSNAAGIEEYGRIFKDENEKPMIPLENEIVSRAQMQITPPHILVTNYAMLEYMMLRPKDDLVFSGAKLRFLVLDEAHIYRGTTGMETSLLLKRLKARISNPANVLHILTSATLGGRESDEDIVRFAGTLCSAEFYKEDIIRSNTVQPSYDAPADNVPLKLFDELAKAERPLNEIASDYGFAIADGQTDADFLYEICTRSSVYRNLRSVAGNPMTIPEITRSLRTLHDVTEQDVVNIIRVASLAVRNGSPLIKARYHMFAKAMEGAYITIGQHRKLMLTRNSNTVVDGEELKVFECAVCDDCGRVAVAGAESCGILEFSNNSHDVETDYYLLRDCNDVFPEWDDEDDEEYENEENSESSSEIGKNDYYLCAKCGALFHESLKTSPGCDCGAQYYVRVRKAEKGKTTGKGRCPGCGAGSFKTFYLGNDAATSVLATSLYEQLPESETVLASRKADSCDKKNPFGSIGRRQKNDVVKRKKQFLTFSDSRGEAAFFASYMSSSYSEFLRRRGIWHVIDRNRENMAAHPWEIKTFVDELTAYFDSCRTFAEPGDNGSSNLTPVSRKNAWIAVLNEMVNARRTTSLSAMGIVKFSFKGNTDDNLAGVAEDYKKDLNDIKALFDLLVMDIVYHGAIEGECSLTDDEREYIYYISRPKRVKKCKDPDRDKKRACMGWAAYYKKNGKLQSNGRLRRVMKALGMDEADANELLMLYWKYILQNEGALSSEGNSEYYFKTEQFTVAPGTEDYPVYVCDVCGKTTMTNCMDMCTTLNCTGHLHRVSHKSLLEDNHYARLYMSALMQPLHIKEHTAQLGRKEQQRYQEQFVKKELNALSCSTTFEMGVDVGDLETVYLRNMPPSPANYVQRAGRAGRSVNAAAFSLTYSKLSSHDFTYYRNPDKMITGKIGVPVFSIRNEKVILRHIFAVALSDFFAKNPDVYNRNDANVLLNGDGWERLCTYLKEKPDDLRDILRMSIPEEMHKAMGIEDYSWADSLIGDDGVLKIAVEQFRTTVEYYVNEVERNLSEHNAQEAAKNERKLKMFRRGDEDGQGRNELIEFLVRNNVLPKYGFPVDTVELYQNANVASDDKLQMVRDLQLAISEYAPDAQVVANGKLYTSRYIRKLPQATGQDWETSYIAQCRNPACATWNYRSIEPGNEGEECVSCHGRIDRRYWRQAIEPRKGFIADSTPKDVPMRRPDKIYRSDDYYIGDVQRHVIQKYAFSTETGNVVTMDTSTNDSLMVVCNDDFYVCPLCGYSESGNENRGKSDYNSHKMTLERIHNSPWGKGCEGTLIRNKLCHTFKTDAVRLVFENPFAESQNVMLSVMYALLEAMSSVLDIERNDIKGCLHKVTYNGSLIYSIILYDAVAGGAGHVRRLATEDGENFRKVVEKAIEITKGCNCSPSCYNCLRNYYNQKIHDKLNRKYAYDFLENYTGELKPVESEE